MYFSNFLEYNIVEKNWDTGTGMTKFFFFMQYLPQLWVVCKVAPLTCYLLNLIK